MMSVRRRTRTSASLAQWTRVGPTRHLPGLAAAGPAYVRRAAQYRRNRRTLPARAPRGGGNRAFIELAGYGAEAHATADMVATDVLDHGGLRFIDLAMRIAVLSFLVAEAALRRAREHGDFALPGSMALAAPGPRQNRRLDRIPFLHGFGNRAVRHRRNGLPATARSSFGGSGVWSCAEFGLRGMQGTEAGPSLAGSRPHGEVKWRNSTVRRPSGTTAGQAPSQGRLGTHRDCLHGGRRQRWRNPPRRRPE